MQLGKDTLISERKIEQIFYVDKFWSKSHEKDNIQELYNIQQIYYHQKDFALGNKFLFKACQILTKPNHQPYGESFGAIDDIVLQISWDLAYFGQLDSSYQINLTFWNHHLKKTGLENWFEYQANFE